MEVLPVGKPTIETILLQLRASRAWSEYATLCLTSFAPCACLCSGSCGKSPSQDQTPSIDLILVAADGHLKCVFTMHLAFYELQTIFNIKNQFLKGFFE